MMSDEQERRDAQDQQLRKLREKQAEQALRSKLRWQAQQRTLTKICSLVQENSICQCEVEDAEIPCWKHEPEALDVLWVALGAKGSPAQRSQNANTWSFFFGLASHRTRFCRTLGVPSFIKYKPDSRGYRLYVNNNMRGTPKACGQELPEALKRFQAKLQQEMDPNGVITEKTRELPIKDLRNSYGYAVDEVMEKIRKGKSGSRTLPPEEFTWRFYASAPNGSKGTDESVVLSVVLVATRRGGSWRSSELPTVPRLAAAYWHANVKKRERREKQQSTRRKQTPWGRRRLRW
jgi:hypothetical protein